MATTSPNNIWTPDAGDDYALTTDLAAMADTIQAALTTIFNSANTSIKNLARGRSTTTQTGIQGSYVTLSGISVGVSLSAMSNLHIAAQVQTFSANAADVANLRLMDNGTEVANWSFAANSSPVQVATPNTVNVNAYLNNVTSGNHTYTLQLQRSYTPGGGSLTSTPSTNSPTFLAVNKL